MIFSQFLNENHATTGFPYSRYFKSDPKVKSRVVGRYYGTYALCARNIENYETTDMIQ